MFKSYIYGKIEKCANIEEYRNIRKHLVEFGVEKFVWDLENLKIFKDGYILEHNNPFALIILKSQENKIQKRDYTKLDDFIMITSKAHPDHKLIIPKNFEWNTFNVLTLMKKDIPMIETMQKIANKYIEKHNLENPLLCFHCYPFNSVNSLHLHIVDPKTEPSFILRNNNLPLSDVLQYLKDL